MGNRLSVQNAFAAVKDLAEMRAPSRLRASRGNSGQVGALRTLNDAGVPLTNLMLEEIDLTWLSLVDAYMVNANLRGAILRNADLTGAYLAESDLRDADFRPCNPQQRCAAERRPHRRHPSKHYAVKR